MKTFRPYLLFSVGAAMVSVVISKLLRFSLTNTWQAGVALLFVFGPVLLYVWKAAIQQKQKRPFLSAILKICVVVFVVGALLGAIVAMR
ncbi:MAG: hypothetical protein IKA63_02660 [Clostridia bacterium]|nr:hypothetical protein [Clostridia bacterium]